MSVKHRSGPSCPSCDAKLAEVEPDLVRWYLEMKVLYPDLHISWGYRGQDDQMKAFKTGASRLPWPRSAHNHMPSLAIDLFQLVDGKAVWDPKFLTKVAGHITPDMRWGGNFRQLGDSDHIELVSGPTPPQAA